MTLPPVIAFVSEMYCHGKPIIASDAAEDLLVASHVPAKDGAAEGIVRAKQLKGANALIDGLVTALLQHRFPARQPETNSV
jgi:hypothetical protein